MTDYVTENEFRAFIKDTKGLNPEAVTTAITMASRSIDQVTNRPSNAYVPAAVATAKYFGVHRFTECHLRADDVQWEFWTTDSLEVLIDQNGDGIYETTLTNDINFYLNPTNGARYGISGWPFDELQILANGGLTFPRSLPGYREPVKITAKWGWAATPDQIKFATKLAANRYFGRGDTRYGTAGFDASGFAMRIKADPDIMALLEPFIPASRMVA